MEFLANLIRGTAWFFLAYSLIYILQWLVGLLVSMHRLSRCPENKQLMRRILPDSIAKQLPVSVIVPAYNEKDCICDTVDSLLRDDYPNLEIIVVDDGSKDGTSEHMIRNYQMVAAPYLYSQQLHTQPVREFYRQSFGDKRLVLVRKENGGKGDALNCGFNFSHSPYCVVVDADTQVRPGSLRIMAGHFALDDRTIVCAGAVGTLLHSNDAHRKLPLRRKLLVLFQHMEYYRTFYMQRILFDALNANLIVSGAFAMFDRDLVIRAGGYKTSTIGEDMELTMRLHAFCLSQHQEYKIDYAPEARCDTQVPFRYRDYFRQRRRWHIGMIQSLHQHLYMIGNHYYGWVGILSVLFTLMYELLAPFIELIGVGILLLSAYLDILNPIFACILMACYLGITLLTQSVMLSALRAYDVEPMTNRQHLRLLLASSTECIFFHPINILIKISTLFTYQKHRNAWNHVQRVQKDGLSLSDQL